MNKKFSNLGMSNGVLPTGFTDAEARAQFLENTSKLPRRKEITEAERLRLAAQAAKQSGVKPTS